MKYKSIKNIGNVVSGSTPKRLKPEYWNGNINWASLKDISKLTGPYLTSTLETITELGYKSCSTQLLPEGTVLLSSRAPIGHLAVSKIKVCTNQGFKSIIPNDDVNSLYLYFALKHKIEEVKGLGTGTTFTELSKKRLEKFELPFPETIEDQKRIAQVLTDCEELIAKRKESIALLDELLKSTFLEKFGDPRNNEGNWEFDKVIEYADCIVPGRDKPKSFTGDIPWVTTNDLKHLSFTKESKDKIGLSEDEISEVKARTVPSGSVLMTCVGDLGVVSIATQRMLVNQQLHSFQCKDSINNIFLMYALSFQTEYMYKRASTTTVPYLNKTNCNSIPVIKPPIDLQTEFALKVEKVEEIKKLFQNHLTEIENLYSRLSQDAFKGVLDLSKMVLKKSSFNLEKSEAAIKSQIITEAQTKYNQTPVEIEFIIDNVLNKDFDNKIFSVLDIWKKTKNHQTNITSSLIRSSLKEYIKNDKIEQVYDENLKEILFKLKK